MGKTDASPLFDSIKGDRAPWARTEPLNEDERSLVGLALALGAREVDGWSEAETELAEQATRVTATEVGRIKRQVQAGNDPLGKLFCDLYSPAHRRPRGATYTPPGIVKAMLSWAEKHATPARVVDPGAGSGLFTVAAGRRFPHADLVAVELDPLPALLARGHLAAAGFASRSSVLVSDYRDVPIEPIDGRTLYIGNPPYVRHHAIDAAWKQWLIREAKKRKLNASQLAGLHAHFFLATLLKASPKDYGSFITAAEWLDVNYGQLIRDLFVGPLGGRCLVVIEPTVRPFPDAATTAVVSQFEVGSRSRSVYLRRVESLADLKSKKAGRPVRRERLEAERRWSHLTRRGRKEPSEYIELGELCRVHRGAVTGANKFWIEGEHCAGLPDEVFFPSVTKARDLFQAGSELKDASRLRRVIDLPADLDVFDSEAKKAVDRFLRQARKLGIHKGYVAANRRAWWSVGLREPAPILATYMARRPPAFVKNSADARHINIAHGLYPREPLNSAIISRLASYLSNKVKLTDGRTYSGGLTKFEPREMERLLVPPPELLLQGSA